MSIDYPTDIPDGWAVLPEHALEHAMQAVRAALDPKLAVPRLREYYDVSSDYAGATFVELVPVDPHAFTAADLLALTLLSVDAPSPQVTRHILEPGPTRTELQRLLGSPLLGIHSGLADAGAETLAEMALLYEAVKAALGRDPWVTASKLVARKRPQLFPVRDALVRDLLGLSKYGNYQVDWQVFRAIIRDDDINKMLRDVRDEAARGPAVVIDSYPLRWLDVALWTQARAITPRRR